MASTKGESTIPLVIDTGSAVTALSADHAWSIGIQTKSSDGASEVTTLGIGGEVKCSTVDVQVYFLTEDGTFRSFSLAILVLPESNPLPSILGRDLLQYMDLRVAPTLGLLSLDALDG